MKSIFWYFRCLAILVIIPNFCLNAQSLFKMTEITMGGNVYEINPVFDKENPTILKRNPNIDINSSINIEINTEKIREEAAKWLSVKSDLPVAHMKGISDYLSKRLDLINDIRVTSNNLAEKQKVLQRFSNSTAPVFQILNKLEPSNPLKAKVNLILSVRESDATVTYNKIFDLLQQEINSVELEYKTAVEQNKVFFRLGTFVNNTPVHLEGFDSYKEGEYYFVPPFITIIPEDQKQAFEQHRITAVKANEDALKSLTDKLLEVATPLLDSLKRTLQTKFSEPISIFENTVVNINTISDDVKSEINLNKEEITNLIASTELLIADSKNMESADYMENLFNSINRVLTDFQELNQSLTNTIAKLETSTVPLLKPAATDLKTSYTTGKKIVADQIKAIKGIFDSKSLLQISFTEKITESLLKLGDEVTKLPLDNVKDQATLDLKRTIVRKNGDRLSFKAVLTKSSPEQDKQEEKTIDYTTIGLYQIGLHNSIQAALILTDNVSGEFASNKQFQFNPSYSVLFKWGSRKSSFYNDFVELGVGINMATLDFDNDDDPEVGMGLVVSAFKDYLQVGYGRNFGADQDYWFFGIRLPFLGMNLDSKPIVSTTTDQ